MTHLQLSLLHIPAIVVHGNALTMEVWGHWFTPAHVLGGWSHRLRARKAEDAMPELIGSASTTAVAEVAGAPVEATQPSVRGVDIVEQDNVAVLERARAETVGLADLFEEAIAALPAAPAVFDPVDQLTPF